MSEPVVPVWQTILNYLGLSSLIGIAVGFFLSRQQRRREWADENRKCEWRELIDELNESLAQMSRAFLPVDVVSGADDPDAGRSRGFRVIRNRIFIADALKKHHVLERWEELSERTAAARDAVGFCSKVKSFQEHLMETARKDLGL